MKSLPLLIFFIFLPFYLITSSLLWQSPVYERDDVFFRADTKRAFNDLVGDREGSHLHTSGHPNFVIFHQPFGAALRSSLKYVDKKISGIQAKKLASVILSSVAAAATVSLFSALLLQLEISRSQAMGSSLLFGLSTTHIVFASIPETYIFSALGLTAIAYCASQRRIHPAYWQLACLYAVSNLTTNIINVGIWALVKHHTASSVMLWIRRVMQSLAITVGLVAAVNCVQHLIYPKTVLFFMPSSVGKESGWITFERLQSPWEHSSVLFKHFFSTNILAPSPAVARPFDTAMASLEHTPVQSYLDLWPAHLLWIVLLSIAGLGLTQRNWRDPIPLATVSLLAFNFFFFFLFGHDRMLYTGLWTHLSLLLLALGWQQALTSWPKLTRILPSLLFLMAAAQVIHHIAFLKRLQQISSLP